MAIDSPTARRAPDFGPLAGVKVVYSGQALAGPFAANLMAEFGADVLWLENPLMPDITRTAAPWTFEMERRNQRTLALNIPTPEGSEILLRLLADTEIFIEASKGGQFAKWGLDDDRLRSVNPGLVIVHVSGYGQDGDPEYTGRAAFDPIAQAFGCYLQHNGSPDGPPMPATPYPGDYMTGLFACFGSLSALIRSRETGQGDSIDVAMFEVLMRCGGAFPMEYLNEGVLPQRKHTRVAHGAGTGVMPCADGADVYVIVRGAGVLARALSLVGLEYGSELFPAGTHSAALGTPAGDLLDRRISDYCLTHTAKEVDVAFNAEGIPCSMIYTYPAAERDPHYIARKVFTEWEDARGKAIRGVNIVPKFAERPGSIWSGSPEIGRDTDDVLRALGYSVEDLERLEEAGVVRGPLG